jgi:hypothetical protein
MPDAESVNVPNREPVVVDRKGRGSGAAKDIAEGSGSGAERWSRLSKQIFRVDKWSLCQG